MSKHVETGKEVSGEAEPQSIRHKLKKILHSHQFHLVIIFLVVLDCVFVIAELILDFNALQAAAQCHNETVEENSHGSTDEHTDPHKTDSTSHDGSDTHAEHGGASLVLHYMSLSILSIFMVELIVKLAVLQKEILDHKWEIFDGIVVVISFTLDLVSLIYMEALVAMESLVLLRLWRIVRVVDAVLVSVETHKEEQIEKQEHLQEEAEDELGKYMQYCAVQENEIEVLREELKRNDIEIDDNDLQSEKPTGFSKQMDIEVEANEERNKLRLRRTNVEKPQSNETRTDDSGY